MMSKIALASAALAVGASAQVAVYGQCGGTGWTGATTCAAGSSCVTVNPYYFQCQPGATTLQTSAGGATTKPTTAPATTTKAPATTTTKAGSPTTSAAGGTTAAPAAGNPFAGKKIYANKFYASEILSLAVPSLPAAQKAAASAVANVGTYYWLDTAAKVPTMDTVLGEIETLNAAGGTQNVAAFVVYDLPNRDCAAAASNGEYSVANNGLVNYKAYIDAIAAIIKKHPKVTTTLVIEPDSLGNLITNSGVAKCAEAKDAYISGIEYALSTLNLPNVYMYLDAAHGGWLGWSANIGPAVTLFSQVYTGAGKPAALRGFATNVANYNAFTIATCPAYTSPNTLCDENRYINALAPLLTAAGVPAHFITDTGRNGVQPTAQIAQGDWCNLIGTGFGARPSTNTGNSLVDSFVWVKPGGEGDGTSNTTAARYDFHCGLADALQPAPEAGTWFQAYFAQLLTNANPSF